MGFFKKESGVDVLDLTLLQKRGLLKIPQVERRSDIIDLTMQLPSPPSMPAPPSLPQPITPLPTFFDSIPSPSASSTPVADNPFGMLDTLASASSAASPTGGSVDSLAFNALKLKLDDVEFKLERLVEKFSLLDEKLQQEYNLKQTKNSLAM